MDRSPAVSAKGANFWTAFKWLAALAVIGVVLQLLGV